jgi:hypothetical protein
MAFKKENKLVYCCFYNDGIPGCIDIKKGWFLGSGQEWDVHVSYERLKNELLYYKTNDIDTIMNKSSSNSMPKKTPLRRSLTPVFENPKSAVEIVKPG